MFLATLRKQNNAHVAYANTLKNAAAASFKFEGHCDSCVVISVTLTCCVFVASLYVFQMWISLKASLHGFVHASALYVICWYRVNRTPQLHSLQEY